MSACPPLALAAVVPTHNTRELTLRCLGSLVASGLDPSALFIVDDLSEDGTVEAIEQEFPRANLLRNQHRSGFTRSANRGLEEVLRRGDPPLLALVNSDTVVPSNWLSRVQEAFAAPEVGLWGPQLVYPNGRAQWSAGHRLPGWLWLAVNASGILHHPRPAGPPEDTGGLELAGDLSHTESQTGQAPRPETVAWLPATCLVLRREVWRDLGPFAPEFRLYAQDLDLCSRADRAGWTAVLDRATCVLHEHGATVRQSSSAPRDLESALLDLHHWARRHRAGWWATGAKTAMLLGGACGFLADGARALRRARSPGALRTRSARRRARALRSLLLH